MMKEKRSTLSNLLNTSKVIIPIIQRDYAQGRTDEHSKLVRENFLKAIHSSIKDNKPLDLNFIYGKADKVDGKKCFYPVDGQQRLTTLFLVHWYLIKKHGIANIKSTKINWLNNFSYEARFTSKEFFKSFIENLNNIVLPQIDTNNQASEENSLQKEIKNFGWFDDIWKFDPTVKGVLTTLEDIATIFDDITKEQVQTLLTTDCPITFILEDMEDLGEPDALYIKLNSRGRPLTYLELFKAKIFDIISQIQKEIDNNTTEVEDDIKEACNNFKQNFDNNWTNLVWKHIIDSSQPQLFDKAFLNIFGIIYTNYLFEKDSLNKSEKGKKKKTDNNFDNSTDNNGQEKLDKDKYNDIKDYNVWVNDFGNYSDGKDEFKSDMKTYLATSYKVFNSIYNAKEEYKKIVLEIAGKGDNDDKSKKGITYDDRAIIYALTQYILKYQDINEDKFKEFYRVFKNLLNNSVGSEKIDSIEDLQNAFKSIKNLVEYSENNILQELTTKQNKPNMLGFSKYQQEEELIKARIMLSGKEFNCAILSAEQDDYFEGQIGSALHLSESNGKYDINLFNNYWAKIHKLFENYDDNNNYIKKNYLIHRALLCFDDYRLPAGTPNKNGEAPYKTLCPNDKYETHKTTSLKTLFTQHSKQVKALLDEIDASKDIKKQLEEIINNKKKELDILDWRYLFIDEPKMFDNGGELRTYEVKDKIYLLKNVKNTQGSNQDVYLKYLYIKLSELYNNKDNRIVTFDSGETECELRFNKQYRLEHDKNNIVLTQNGRNIINFEIKVKDFINEINKKLKECPD